MPKKSTLVSTLLLSIGLLLKEIYNFLSSPALHFCMLPVTFVYNPKLLVFHLLIAIGLYFTWSIPEDDY